LISQINPTAALPGLALRVGTPAKTTFFAGRPSWLGASPLRKFPQGIFANKQ
jgi:hypothetical protein